MQPVRELLAEYRLAPAAPQAPGATTERALPPTACPDCAGAGWYTLAVPLGHPEFGKLQPCACKRAEQARRRADELEQLSNLAAMRGKTFAVFDRLVPGVQTAYQLARAYASAPATWLGLFGGYGCGKTHLAAAIANCALDAGIAVLFVVVPDLLDHLRSTYAPERTVSYDQRFEAVRQAPLLVLDDLGTESTTNWAREKLYQLVNHRYNTRLPTVFTSNVGIEQLDPRIASRMHDQALGAALVTITAGDYRRAGQRRT